MLIDTFIRYIVSPQELLDRQAITPLFRERILRWLRPLEFVVRLLVLIMAKSVALAPQRKRKRKFRERAWRDFNPCLHWPQPRKEREESNTPREPSPPRRWERVVVASRPIAERIEGVARVIDNPEAAARRLARRLQNPERAEAALAHEPPGATEDIPLRAMAIAMHAQARALYPKPEPHDEALPPPRDDSS
ncbi:MAG: hypothetical protein AB7T08_08635 [Hyphomonadaceae bacterium]